MIRLSAPLSLSFFIFLIATPQAKAETERSDKPNIVINFPTHQAYGDVGCDGAEGWYKPPFDRIAAQGGRFHELGHSHGSGGAGSGLAMPLLANLLGHSSTAMTERYAHLADDPVKAASEAIGSRIAAALDADPLAPVFRVVARDG